jgi:4-hydroxybenzoate polyprenyltransferase
VDRDDDLKIGVKSTAILFADMDRVLIGLLQLLMLLSLWLIGRGLQFGAWYYAGVIVTGMCFIHQQWLIHGREPAACLKAFLNNNYVGMAIFIGIALQYLYA